MRTIIIAAVLMLSVFGGYASAQEPYHIDPGAVAAKCRGEAEFAIVPCSCTVLNRLRVGWAPSKVLSAYYAASIPATPEQITAVADVLDGSAVCDPALYFMFSKQDTINLGIDNIEPVLTVRSGDKEVIFLERWFRKR